MISGIYKITNIINNKVYIGSAIKLKQRFYHHKYYLNKHKHKNKYLQLSWSKYGSDNFKFEIVEYCEVNRLIEREQYWIDKLKCYDRKIGYNINPIAGSSLGKPCSKETKLKISLANKGNKWSDEAKKKITGRKYSEEHRKRISEAPISDELRLKRSINAKGNQNRRDKIKWPCELGIKCLCGDCILKKKDYHKQRYLNKRKILSCEY